MTKKYLAAISGGPDSMALLDLYKDSIKAVCTVNYKKRIDSDKDQKIVEDYCQQHNIDCYVKVVSNEDYEDGGNFQNLARIIRYDFFLEIAHQLNIDTILIAHNLNDHLETAYMNIEKKSLSPYYGIKRENYYQDLRIIRPLLDIKKDDLQLYCDLKKIPYAIDSSNESDVYERNRVRKIINKFSEQKLNQFKTLVDEFNALNKKYNKDITIDNGFFYNDFINLSNNNKYRYLYRYFRNNDVKMISKTKLDNIICFIESKSYKKYLVQDNLYLSKDKKGFYKLG